MAIQGLWPITSLLVGIAATYAAGLPLSLGVAFSILVSLVTVRKMGYSFKQQFQFGWAGVQQTKPVLSILFLIGLLIPLLMVGGTIPALIYYGLSVVNVDYLLILSFLLASAISSILGTSMGTLSTIGLPLIGIAHAAGVPLGMVAGALISGAMVGERFSPISSSRLLTMNTVELSGAKAASRMNVAAMVAVIFTGCLFLMLDALRGNAGATDMIATYQRLLKEQLDVSLPMLFPIAFLLLLFLFRLRAVTALMGGIAVSAGSALMQPSVDLHSLLSAILDGYALHSGTALDEMVHGKGIGAVLQILVLIIFAGFLNGILNKANLVEPIITRLMGKSASRSALVGKTVLLSLVVVMIGCNQTIPILLVGATLLERYRAQPNGSWLLGRTLLDSALLMPVLVPWNGLAMVMAVTLGVSTVESLPYLLFPILLPILTILFTKHFVPMQKEAASAA
ncbi:Na+/H+ antiporter NhaC family protein [Brevibacillus migulae]|uniref:Na+/H+ antiporter NhaC family protein n=1 Tax=Brevibacillus migulae TaxID=1644114 RepID=UPI00106E5B3E|nr:Na+/H+ antiporter NhaC family protein [Brevibacillus migulae]